VRCRHRWRMVEVPRRGKGRAVLSTMRGLICHKVVCQGIYCQVTLEVCGRPGWGEGFAFDFGNLGNVLEFHRPHAGCDHTPPIPGSQHRVMSSCSRYSTIRIRGFPSVDSAGITVKRGGAEAGVAPTAWCRGARRSIAGRTENEYFGTSAAKLSSFGCCEAGTLTKRKATGIIDNRRSLCCWWLTSLRGIVKPLSSMLYAPAHRATNIRKGCDHPVSSGASRIDPEDSVSEGGPAVSSEWQCRGEAASGSALPMPQRCSYRDPRGPWVFFLPLRAGGKEQPRVRQRKE
jgi:hypothetical protein